MNEKADELVENAQQAATEKNRKRVNLGRKVGAIYLILFFGVGIAAGYALLGDTQIQAPIKTALLALFTVFVSYLVFIAIRKAKNRVSGSDR